MIHNVTKKNTYFDSVTLMLFSSKLEEIEGVNQAAAMMGTDHNKVLMQDSGLLKKEAVSDVTANDLIIGIDAENQEAVDQALQTLEDQFANKSSSKESATKTFKTFDQAIKENPDANLSVISIPGRFARSEVMKSLKKGLHVMLYSDNVSLEDEIALKDYALENDLLMMGPDCGTAIINGVALGFANVVNRGNIGLSAASGTGLQEVSVIIDKLGGGISQALGTGGRDLKEEVDGRMMLFTLDALANDDETEVIGLISKPPAESVMKKIVDKAAKIKKPIVACFLGGNPEVFKGTNIIGTTNLEEAAYTLVKTAAGEKADALTNSPLYQKTDEMLEYVNEGKAPYVRGLYTGGTLAYEALLLLDEKLDGVYSNIAIDKRYDLKDLQTSKENTILDMGEDYFTEGAPHPMIDPKQRADRIIKEAKDKDTGIILLDCVLGHGSHDDPAASIVKAVEKVKNDRKDIVFIASVTGTKKDPQDLEKTQKTLKDAGVHVLPTNNQAVNFALEVLKKRGVING